jgi:CHAD domain-containing protein
MEKMKKKLSEIGFELGFIGKGNGEIIINDVDFGRVIEKYPIVGELEKATTTSHWHREGDMLTHTKMVTSEMVKCLRERQKHFIMSEHVATLMILSAIFHDIGKVGCRIDENGRLLSHGHPKRSAEIVSRMFSEYDLGDILTELVLWHDLYCETKIGDKKLRHKMETFSDFLMDNIMMLIELFRCDDRGSIHDPNESVAIMTDRILEMRANILSDRFRQSLKNGEFDVQK